MVTHSERQTAAQRSTINKLEDTVKQLEQSNRMLKIQFSTSSNMVPPTTHTSSPDLTQTSQYEQLSLLQQQLKDQLIRSEVEALRQRTETLSSNLLNQQMLHQQQQISNLQNLGAMQMMLQQSQAQMLHQGQYHAGLGMLGQHPHAAITPLQIPPYIHAMHPPYLGNLLSNPANQRASMMTSMTTPEHVYYPTVQHGHNVTHMQHHQPPHYRRRHRHPERRHTSKPQAATPQNATPQNVSPPSMDVNIETPAVDMVDAGRAVTSSAGLPTLGTLQPKAADEVIYLADPEPLSPEGPTEDPIWTDDQVVHSAVLPANIHPPTVKMAIHMADAEIQPHSPMTPEHHQPIPTLYQMDCEQEDIQDGTHVVLDSTNSPSFLMRGSLPHDTP